MKEFKKVRLVKVRWYEGKQHLTQSHTKFMWDNNDIRIEKYSDLRMFFKAVYNQTAEIMEAI